MRVKRLLLIFCALLMGIGTSPWAIAEESEPIPVQWYEPKVQATTVPGLTYVSLVGKTEPNVSVHISAESIVVIQPAEADSKVQPRVGETSVQSEEKGFFRLRLFLPNGLSQVPINFTNSRGQAHPVLLTMRVSPNDVSLNVKLIRPTKTKIVKVLEKPPVTFQMDGGWAPLSFQEKLSPSGSTDLNLQNSYLQSLRLNADIRSLRWWWLMSYQTANVAAPEKIGDRSVQSGGANLQSMRVGGKYRLPSLSPELWLGVDVDALFFPLLATDTSSRAYLIDARLFKAGFSFSYLLKKKTWDYLVAVAYREPFAIKVGSGEVVYASKYSLELQGELVYHWSANWSSAARLELETNSFSYEYNNSPSLIANRGAGNVSILQLLGLVRYSLR